MTAITDRFVLGNDQRPDLALLWGQDVYPVEGGGLGTSRVFKVPLRDPINKISWVPVVPGITRAFMSVVHTIIHLSIAIFDKQNREEHISEAKLGVINFGRGVLEAIPVVGYIVMRVIDNIRLIKLEASSKPHQPKGNEPFSKMMLFINNKKAADRDYACRNEDDFITAVKESYTFRNGLRPIIDYMKKV